MGSVTDRHNQLLNTSRGFKRLLSLIGELTIKVAATSGTWNGAKWLRFSPPFSILLLTVRSE